MKILHTSDLHIGHNFSGIDRSDEFEKFFEFLKQTIKKENIDLLIVSGDIFDVYFPSNSALKQYYDFLASVDIKTIIVGGNHDSANTLKAPKELLKSMNIEVISGDSDDYLKIIELDDVVVVAVSFLREGILRKIDENLSVAIKSIYQNALKEAKKYGKKVIATGHLTAYGSVLGDSEREIYIGNLESIGSDIFEGYDYVALGHIHKPQKIKENIYYSGSPLSLSFTENYQKSMIILDTSIWKIEKIEVPKFREFISLNGTLLEVSKKLEGLKNDSFVEINLEEIVSSSDLTDMRKINPNIHIVKIQIPYTPKEIKEEIETLTPLNIIEKMLKDDESSTEIVNIFKQIQKEVEDETGKISN